MANQARDTIDLASVEFVTFVTVEAFALASSFMNAKVIVLATAFLGIVAASEEASD